MRTEDFLREITALKGLSGDEGLVSAYVAEAFAPYCDEVKVDGMFNVIARKKGSGPKVMFAAHLDEIGLMVSGLEKGFLRIARMGGTDARVLPGREVVVHGQRDLPGMVATRPPHVLPRDEYGRAVPWDKLFVDVGLPPDEVERLVTVGDLISIRSELATLKNRRVAGKALDDRASVAAVTLALEQLANVQHTCDVVAVATAQEETGLKGAMTSAFGIAPDVAIALDVTFGAQPGVSDHETFPLDGGPTLGTGPNFHPKLVQALKQTAEDHEIGYHMEAVPGRSGTDAWAVQVSREGVPTALLGIPLRYMHQPVEMLAVQDVERAGRLLAAFISGLAPDFMTTLAWMMPAESE